LIWSGQRADIGPPPHGVLEDHPSVGYRAPHTASGLRVFVELILRPFKPAVIFAGELFERGARSGGTGRTIPPKISRRPAIGVQARQPLKALIGVDCDYET